MINKFLGLFFGVIFVSRTPEVNDIAIDRVISSRYSVVHEVVLQDFKFMRHSPFSLPMAAILNLNASAANVKSGTEKP